MSQTIYTPSISNIEEHETDKSATFTIEPLLSGYGMTLGNSLRRVLLSSISGAAVVAFKAEGASHEFTTLPGIKEDLVQIMLNLKGIRFRITDVQEGDRAGVSEREPLRLKLSKKGAGAVTAGDIQSDISLEVVNSDHHIATLNAAGDKIELELVVGFGLGYLPIEDSEASYAGGDLIALDALFSPVLRVRYRVENTRVGRMTDLDKLSLTIETDASIAPRAAFEEAAAILKAHYDVLSGATAVEAQSFQQMSQDSLDEQSALEVDKRLGLYLEDLHLSARTTNALINNNLHTIQDVINLSEAELKELKGFGIKALKELKDKFKELGF